MSKSSSYTDDYYSHKAQREGVRARSYYKLEEIDRKFGVFSSLKETDWILDLGCCPGSWVQYALKVTRNKVRVLGIDLKETEDYPEFPGKFYFIEKDIEKVSDTELLIITGDRRFSVVMSDMAPNTSGNPDQDAYLSYELVLMAWEMAKRLLFGGSRGGVFITKYFQGGESQELLDLLRKEAKTLQAKGLLKLGQVKLFKPASCRKSSREIYIVVR